MRTSDNTPIRHTSLRASPRASPRRVFLESLVRHASAFLLVVRFHPRVFRFFSVGNAPSASAAAVCLHSPHRRRSLRARTRSTPCSRTSACRGDTGGTSRSAVATCRADRPGISGSATSSCRGGTGCTPGSCPSPCRAGKDCIGRTCASPCHAGSRCTRRSCSAACRVRTRRTSRSSPFADRAGTARAPTPSRERGLAPRVTFGRTQGMASWLSTTASLGFLSESETTRRGAPSSSCAELAAKAQRTGTRRSRACSRIGAARTPWSPPADPASRRGSSPSWRSPSARLPGDARAPFPGPSPPSRRVEPRRTCPCSKNSRRRRRPAHPAPHRRPCARARRVQPGPAVRHRGGFDAVSPGARRGTRERRVRRNARRQVRGVRAARARGASPAEERRTASGHAYVTRESTLPLEKTFEFESLTHTRGGHYTHYTIPRDGVAGVPRRARTPSQTSARAPRTPGAPKPPPRSARVLEFTKNAERAAETRDAAARQAAAAVLLEVEAARAAAADASHRLGALETPRRRDARGVAFQMARRRGETFAEAHGETMRVIEKQSELIRSFINVTKHFRRFARKHTRAVWGVLEAARRDARARHATARRSPRKKTPGLKTEKTHFFKIHARMVSFARSSSRRGDSRVSPCARRRSRGT